MIPKSLIRISFELSTIYTIFLIVVFIIKKDTIIPLTYRSTVYKWGELQKMLRDHPMVFELNDPLRNNVIQKDILNMSDFNSLLSDWCPKSPDPLDTTPASSQCACIQGYVPTFINNSVTTITKAIHSSTNSYNGQDFINLQVDGVTSACLVKHMTWRRQTCDHFCQMHLAVPMLISSLCMSLFFSRIVEYGYDFTAMLAAYVPLLLALTVIIVSFVGDALGAIPAVLTVLSAVMEMHFTCGCVEDARVYWSFQRYFMGSVALWAAMSHQGRDLYVMGAYAALGFFAGMLAYTVYILRHKQCCNMRMRVVSIHAWLGVCVISAAFFLLVQQHWYPESPMWSSLVSVACLLFTCLQCIAMAPGMPVSNVLQLFCGLCLLSVGVLTVAVDVFTVRDS